LQTRTSQKKKKQGKKSDKDSFIKSLRIGSIYVHEEAAISELPADSHFTKSPSQEELTSIVWKGCQLQSLTGDLSKFPIRQDKIESPSLITQLLKIFMFLPIKVLHA
jgi:hypothetical protein